MLDVNGKVAYNQEIGLFMPITLTFTEEICVTRLVFTTYPYKDPNSKINDVSSSSQTNGFNPCTEH